MGMQAYLYDNDYMYVRPVIVEPDRLPPNCTMTEPQDGLWKGQYQPDKDIWLETASGDEIEEIMQTMKRGCVE
ncbi:MULTISPECIES: hypothetical protein [Bacillus subtilis group]|uniref:hypothetical protein n=1 Tax=Bacillus subtilis group TaxID=653685 RepID=UPI0022828EED|nr:MULTISPECIES: hypothetical protein [Bacillus subtilis group]MCY8467204.1 hypothetical protein [Bacillus atrophaeus]MCY8475388.1 hypothetical protein [Bacillus halotolerans]MCY8479756.1 hypothetical protein [Bacillus atrophaeus]MCY8507962.1 hypothetical protein [Bacillus atrophaeus]